MFQKGSSPPLESVNADKTPLIGKQVPWSPEGGLQDLVLL